MKQSIIWIFFKLRPDEGQSSKAPSVNSIYLLI